MKKTKFNQDLLTEELNRFRSINEYSFYKEPNSGSHSLDEVDEEPNDAASDIADELGVPPAGDAPEGTPPIGNDGPTPPPNPANVEEPTQDIPTPPAAPAEPAPAEPPMEQTDDVEIDVTSLVDSTDEAKMAADKASQNTIMLMKKLEDLESRIASMNAVSDKIENLEKEIIKRNPTEVEKLEMRSLNSFPYTQKLTDYWNDKHGQYDVMNTDKKQEYVLNNDVIDSDYSDSNIKNSFSVKPDEYEEEDI